MIGDLFPSEAELSEAYAASRITVRHALLLLEREGFIRRAKARRTVVAAVQPARQDGWLVQSLEDIVAMVGEAELAIESYRGEMNPEAADLLDAPEGTPLPCLRGVLRRDGTPYARSTIYFAPDVGRRLRRSSFDDPVVFRVLQKRLGLVIGSVTHTIWADLAQEPDAARLGCTVGSAILATRLHYRCAEGRPIEVAYTRAVASEGARLTYRMALQAGQT
jgi:GntR family transcriptional regulator